MNKLKKALVQQKKKSQQKELQILGTLGIPLGGQRLVEVPNRNSFVYVQLRSNENEVIQAFNNKVAPSYGLPVMVQREGNRYIVIGVDSQRYQNNWNSFAPYLPRHGNTHSFDTQSGGAGDITWIYSKQFMPLLVIPSGSQNGPNVLISPHTLESVSGTWMYVGNTGTQGLLQYVPNGSDAVMVLVYLDRLSGNPYILVNSGSYFANNLTGTAQVIPYLPNVPNPYLHIPLAGVRLVSGTRNIGWNNIYDVRQFLQYIASGTSSGGGSNFTGAYREDLWMSGTAPQSIQSKGTLAFAVGQYALAHGVDTVASGTASHAEGQNTRALGNYSHAEGLGTIALGTAAHAMGASTRALSDSSHADGQSSVASGTVTYVHGQNNTALSNFAAIIGGRNLLLQPFPRANFSAMLGGSGSVLDATNSVMLGMEGYTGTYPRTTYVQRLNMRSLSSGTPIANLGIDINGNIVSGTSASISIGGSGTVGIMDNGLLLGVANILDLANNLSASISGTVAHIESFPGIYDVTNYGAVGDGATDNTLAINRTISAIPNGGGVLYFPPGQYLTSGGHVLSNPFTVMGDGFGDFNGTGSVSSVYCTSPTNTLFTVTSDKGLFKQIGLKNVAGTTPSAGAGISTQGTNLVQKIDYEDISVYGFYINVDVQVGTNWFMRGCFIGAPVQYGIKIRNTQNGDAGDWSISDCSIYAAKYNAPAAIFQQSSGGGKIVNTKINQSLDGFRFVNGIDLQPNDTTTILLIANNSIENISGNGINITTSGISFRYVVINGNQFGLYGNGSGNAIKINAASINEVSDIIISDNIFAAGTSACAINLTNVNNAKISSNINVSFGALLCTTTCTNISVDGSLAIQDEGIHAGYVDTLNFVGAGVTTTVSGTVANIAIPGGGSSFSGIPVYNHGQLIVTGATTFDFEENLYVSASGTTVFVRSPITTYMRVGQPTSLGGGFYRVPDRVYASGSLGVFVNGSVLTPVVDFYEQLWVSGTYYVYSTGTANSQVIMYGVPCYNQVQPITGTANTLVDSQGVQMVDSLGNILTDSNG